VLGRPKTVNVPWAGWSLGFRRQVLQVVLGDLPHWVGRWQRSGNHALELSEATQDASTSALSEGHTLRASQPETIASSSSLLKGADEPHPLCREFGLDAIVSYPDIWEPPPLRVFWNGT
jgi:hypothetical protein